MDRKLRTAGRPHAGIGYPVLWAFIICLFYWAYLFFTSKIVISCDAIDYEATGRLLQDKGWIGFFKTGPHREPAYIYMVSLAMRLGNALSVPYQPVIVLFELSVLLLTQLLTLFILRLLKIQSLIAACVILYIGISPAILNSALSLFSEIAAYPFILAIVIAGYYSWGALNRSRSLTVLFAAAGGIFCFLMTVNKAVFEIIAPALIALVFIAALSSRKRGFIVNSLIYALVAAGVFYSLIGAYKSANKAYNNNYAVTERGDLKLYGTAVRRTEPLTREHFLVALACVPGEGFCRGIYGKDKCSYWGFEEIDNIGFGKLAELKDSGLQNEEVSRRTIQLAVREVLRNPAQFGLFWFLEVSRMFFWESTQIGFVEYPAVMQRIFDWKPLKNGLRFTVSFLTVVSALYAAAHVWKRRAAILRPDAVERGERGIILLISLSVMCLFIGVYALFDTVTRYSLPIAPLFLIFIAFFTQRVIRSFEGNC
jgi:hypothetical protein